tara:strand:+ start:91108 stop:92673 length:1566 start_codon:yes stop_codon:yes gene_type:complete
VKKPETPKPDASANPAEPKARPSETISIDSKGNASVAKEAAEQKSDAASKAKAATASASATGNGPKAPSGTSEPAPDTKPQIKPGINQKPSSDEAKQAKDEPARQKRGGKAILLFVIIIAGALAAGWLTRALWWRDAEPVLSEYVPAEILAEIAPEAGTGSELTSGTVTSDADTGNTSPTSTSTPSGSDTATNTDTAPDISSDVVERDDAMLGNEDNLTPPENNGTLANGGNMPMTAAKDSPVVVDPELTERLSRLEGTINALRERLNSERGDTLNNSVARRIAEIETRTAPIEELARVEAELAGVASEMRELSARLSTMEAEVRATAGLRVESRGQAIAMAVTILRDALQRGGPFMIALHQLERSGSDDPVIAKQIAILKPLADQGAPTVEKLRQSFPVMAQEAIKAASDDHSGTVLDATWANIKKLIPIRRVDVAGEGSLDGRLVTAETALENNDLDAAIAALDGVEGDNARAAINTWLGNAQNRQVLNGAISTLSAHAINLLTGDETGNGTGNTGDSQ